MIEAKIEVYLELDAAEVPPVEPAVFVFGIAGYFIVPLECLSLLRLLL